MQQVGWRSTTLGLAAKHCPAALSFYEAGAPYNRDVFAVGTAAHAILEEVGKVSARRKDWLLPDEAEAVAERVCRELIERGRVFEGAIGDPPMSSAAVFKGRDLALTYHAEVPLAHDFHYEEGVAVNRQWIPCPYDSGAWLRVRIDARGTRMPSRLDEDEDIAGPVLVIRDYKSAWSTGQADLYTLQRKIQAVLSWIKWGDGHDALQLVVVNFRTRKSFDTMVYPNTPEGAAVMARWRRDIEIEIAAREAQIRPDGTRPAVPGAACYGCPYLHQCRDAQKYLPEAFGSDDPVEMAKAYALAEAMIASLSGLLRKATEEEPIDLGDAVLGTLGTEQKTLKDEAPAMLAEIWKRKAHPADLATAMAQLPGLFKALKLGIAQAKALLTFLYRGSEEDRERRRALLASLVTSKVAAQFGLHRKGKPREEESDGFES